MDEIFLYAHYEKIVGISLVLGRFMQMQIPMQIRVVHQFKRGETAFEVVFAFVSSTRILQTYPENWCCHDKYLNDFYKMLYLSQRSQFSN